MFRPNLTGTVLRQTGYDVHGRPKLSDPINISFAQASIGREIEQTASGSGEQATGADSVIMVSKNADISAEDIFSFGGTDYRVMVVYPRRDVFGRVDHYECDLEIFKS